MTLFLTMPCALPLDASAVLPDWAENRGLGYFYFCRTIKILDPRVVNFWATLKNPLADLCTFVLQMRQKKKKEKTVKKQADMVVYRPIFESGSE